MLCNGINYLLIVFWGALTLMLSGCQSLTSKENMGGELTPSKQFVLQEQDRAIEQTRDPRVRKLLRAYQRQHPKAEKTMQDVASYLRYGRFCVDKHGIIYRERSEAVKTPVEMGTLVMRLEQLYLLQDRSLFPVYVVQP